MMIPTETRAWLREQLAALGLSIAELSRLSGVHKATIHRALDENYEFTPSGRTMQKLGTAIVAFAAAKGVEGVVFKDFGTADQLPDQVPYMGGVGIGFHDESPWQPRPSQIAYTPKVARDLQFVFLVDDESANEVFQIGDYIHVIANPILEVIPVQEGNFIVVSREDAPTRTVEKRILQISGQDGQGLFLRAPTTHAEMAATGTLDLNNEITIEGLRVKVFGVVIASYRRHHFLGM
jgi:hypothetical protein